jgi:hypothetical protein
MLGEELQRAPQLAQPHKKGLKTGVLLDVLRAAENLIRVQIRDRNPYFCTFVQANR